MKSYYITVNADIISDIEKSSVMNNENKQSSEAAFSSNENADIFNDSQEADDMTNDLNETAGNSNQSQEKAKISHEAKQNDVIVIIFFLQVEVGKIQ